MSISNMPRLPWKRDPSGGFTAYPNGDDRRDEAARIAFKDNYPWGLRWSWIVDWKGRFRYGSAAGTSQSAADAATDAWWTFLERTEDWRPKPPLATAVDPLAEPRRALTAKLLTWLPTLSTEEFAEVFFKYRQATCHGPTIEGHNDLDRQGWNMCTEEARRRESTRFPRYG